MAENIRDAFFLVDAASNRILYISPAYAEIWGRPAESVYASTDAWTASIHPDDRASTAEKFHKGLSAGKLEYEYRIVRPDEIDAFKVNAHAKAVILKGLEVLRS